MTPGLSGWLWAKIERVSSGIAPVPHGLQPAGTGGNPHPPSRANVRIRPWIGKSCGRRSVAPVDPFPQMGPFGTDGGVRSVTGMDDGVRVEDQHPVADRGDGRAEVGERAGAG